MLLKWNEMKWNIGTYSTSVDSRDFAMFGPLLWPATLIGRIQIKTAWRFNRFGSSWFAMFPVFSIWCLVILVAVCEWFLEKWTSQRCQPMLRNFLFMILICIYPKVAFLRSENTWARFASREDSSLFLVPARHSRSILLDLYQINSLYRRTVHRLTHKTPCTYNETRKELASWTFSLWRSYEKGLFIEGAQQFV